MKETTTPIEATAEAVAPKTAPTLAVTATPGPLASPLPPEGSDIWQLSAESFGSLTQRALRGELAAQNPDL